MTTINADLKLNKAITYNITSLPEVTTDQWYLKSISTTSSDITVAKVDNTSFSITPVVSSDIDTLIDITIGFTDNNTPNYIEEKSISFEWKAEDPDNKYFILHNSGTSNVTISIYEYYLYSYYQKASHLNYCYCIGSEAGTFTEVTHSNYLELSYTIPSGLNLYLYSDTMTSWYFCQSYNSKGVFNGITSDIEFRGNIMALLKDNQFSDSYAFYYLFGYNSKMKTAPVLPATTLGEQCYSYMFSNCTSLTTAPELPATTLSPYCYLFMFYKCTNLTTATYKTDITLARSCYYGMFSNCTNLTNVPDIGNNIISVGDEFDSMFLECINLTKAPKLIINLCNEYGVCRTMFSGCSKLSDISEIKLNALSLGSNSYCYLFENCSSLVTAPELPATTLESDCYSCMFTGCTSLVNIPSVLPAKSLPSQCYMSMFSGCSKIVTPPSIEATKVDYYCCSGMFADCTSLTSAPELKATTMAQGCYNWMFNGCTSLTTAPELPATSLATRCYSYMFLGCSNLNYIKALFTDTPSTSNNGGTYLWVDGVASTGTFVKNSNATWDVTGTSGVPSGWTVLTSDAS